MKKTVCPHCGKAINPAALLGARNAGVTKTLSPEVAAARRKTLAAVRALRWPKKEG